MLTRIFHADLYGTRAVKYATLDAESIDSTVWTELAPASPNYFFVPEDGALREEYQRGWKITDAMPVNSVGIVTARDDLCVHWTRDELWGAVCKFASLDAETARGVFSLGRDTRDWQVALAQCDLHASGPAESDIARILYRPFDVRYTYYTGVSRGFQCMPRAEVMSNMLQANLGLITARSNKSGDVDHFFVSKYMAEAKTGERTTQSCFFPLWLYPHESIDLLDTASTERRPNLAPEFVAALTAAVGTTPTPEDTLAYIYAILYAPSYRQRYADFLKRDFPRVPLTANRDLFVALVAIGRELIALHTVQTTLRRITGYPVAGSNEVVKVRFTPAAPGADRVGRVCINDAQYFDAVPEAVWDMHIGGYRVAEKWLKDRKGRLLSFDDIEHYQQVIAALARTLALQASIGAAIETGGGWPLH